VILLPALLILYPTQPGEACEWASRMDAERSAMQRREGFTLSLSCVGEARLAKPASDRTISPNRLETNMNASPASTEGR
jgi:hypothetical protein